MWASATRGDTCACVLTHRPPTQLGGERHGARPCLLWFAALRAPFPNPLFVVASLRRLVSCVFFHSLAPYFCRSRVDVLDCGRGGRPPDGAHYYETRTMFVMTPGVKP